jgi:hypothetical protein
MSSQKIAGINAAQFTNDNKEFYAYSGNVEITGTTTQIKMLEFQTNSEYITAEIQFMSVEAGGNDLNFFVYLNDILVGTQSIGGAKEFYFRGIGVIIPPFTKLTLKGLNIDAATGRDSTAIVTGKVGMPQRVGN